jgi:hypothetical protein
MLFKSLSSYGVIAAAINTKNPAKTVEAVKAVKALVEKPNKKIIACIGAMDPQYGWTQNPFWDRANSGIANIQKFFSDKYGAEKVMFIAPVAQGFCLQWLKAANESGFDATVVIPSANYIGKPFKEDGIFGTNSMKELFSQIGNLLITEAAPDNNLKPVKMAELLLVALTDELVVFENKNNPKQWIENIASIAASVGVKVIKKDVSPFLNLTPAPVVSEIPTTPIVKLEIKKRFGSITPVPGILSASEEIKHFIVEEGIQQPEPVSTPESPIVAITKGGVTEAVEPPKKKRGRPRKNTVATENEEQKLQEQFMALPG